jgi:two-component sensor histidine kinase
LLYRFAPHVTELPVARRALREWLNRQPPDDRDPDACQELLVIATELCTDALRHAGPGLVTLRAWEDGAAVVVEVAAAETAPVVRNLDDPRDEDGRGMMLVRSLADDTAVVVRDRNRSVRCRKRV